MRIISTTGLLLSLSMLAAAPVRAFTFQDLYTVTVMPEPGAANRRSAAIQAAMRQLLERVTGNRQAAADPSLADLVTDAAGYVSTYATPDGAGGRVQVGFLADKVNGALEQRGRGVWGPERPLTLVWIAIDGGHGERTLLGADESSVELSPEMAALTESIRTSLQDVADERGLPVAWPLLDLQDLDAVSFADIWGGFDQRVQQASQRYGADAILMGRVLVTDVGVSAQWTLLRGASRAVMANDDVSEALQWTADQYAAEYSVVGGVRTLRIVVQDVESLADYGRVMSYLDALSSLQTVDVDSLDGDVLTLHVAARGDADVIRRTFSLGRVLEPADSPSGLSPIGSGNGLVFKVARAAAPSQ